MNRKNIGVDTETLKNGEPQTLQYWEPSGKYSWIEWTSGKKSIDDFINYIEVLPANETAYILWGFNLNFDLGSLFYEIKEILFEGRFKFEYRGWRINGVYGNTVFVDFFKGKRKIYLRDAAKFYHGSLQKVGAMVKPDLPKLKHPRGLGSNVRFKKSDKTFCDYAMRDAELAYWIGEAICEMHDHYDISITVSIAQMASKVFRHKFMARDIPRPPKALEKAAERCYHGGRNNLTVSPGLYKSVYSLDITSAYPAAMRELPSLYNSKLYKKFKSTKLIPKFSICKIWGEIKPCKWPILFDDEFKSLEGEVKGQWVTGFELNEALRMGEIELKKCEGWFYDYEKDKFESPFKAYVDEFFHLKATEKNSIKRETYKGLCNHAYGKFIQTTAKNMVDDELPITRIIHDLEKDKISVNDLREAGGMYHPFAAGQITGHCRVHLHQLEHKYKAIHSSTDSVFTTIKPKEISGLGGVKIEAFGNVLIFRNKVYIFYAKLKDFIKKYKYLPKKELNKKIKDSASILYPGYNYLKEAHHAVHVYLRDLEKLLKKGVYKVTYESIKGVKNPIYNLPYKYIKVNKLKESLNRDLKFNAFEKREANLRLKQKIEWRMRK